MRQTSLTSFIKTDSFVLDFIRENGAKDIISYLRQSGGSPLATNGKWNEKNFDVETLFEQEPESALWIFLDQFLSRCDDPRDNSTEILCFKADDKWRFIKREEQDSKDILKLFKLDDDVKEDAFNDYNNFLMKKQPVQVELTGKREMEVLKIKDLKKKFPELNLNWLKIINNQLLRQSQVTEDEEILLGKPDLMRALFALLVDMDKKLVKSFDLAVLTLTIPEILLSDF